MNQLNIVIPMAGLGSRFSKAGYAQPKPLIPVFGRPMIEVVTENLRPTSPHRFIFVCQREHVSNFGLREVFDRATNGNYEVVAIDGVTDGAARTVLMAEALIDTDNPLMIANCDQYVEVDMDAYLSRQRDDRLDGLIMTMTAADEKWSFVKLDSAGLVTEVREKQVISHEATVGIYNFASGRAFCRAARAMIDAGEKVNGEYYVAPVYNALIFTGARVGIYNIGALDRGMYGLGVPADLTKFLATQKFATRLADTDGTRGP